MPSVRWDGSNVVVSVPSGDMTVEIAMSLHQAISLDAEVRDACRDGFIQNAVESAEMLPFKKPRRKARRCT
jgi:hypothetical protein